MGFTHIDACTTGQIMQLPMTNECVMRIPDVQTQYLTNCLLIRFRAKMSEWQSTIFSCFSDPKLCVFVFCFPPYAYGKSAEAVGEDCVLHGLLAGMGFAPITRWRIRKARNIEGTMLSDVLCHCALPCCALIQEAKETGWNVPESLAVIGTKNDKMARA
ncbi:hypothetical protein CAPTEDRAFT_221615 [Capitella teleta]|uniref:Uncharacterized protein n=1 Tax=Capitella teleta TaxID=283909 RepID=R7UYT6_CAPTE|nr:hypothetical protein CAPTEDRAFT_221615 [Capitella teleta]|eukprot:ELU11499.1 hypothetical protein CAPTEDRAFT_221615 [Capitella teleta]